MKNVLIESVDIEEFSVKIGDLFESKLQEFLATRPEEHEEYLTRKQVAELLQISLVTLHNWTKKGILTGYRISNKRLYKKSEIIDAIKQVPNLKYRRDT